MGSSPDPVTLLGPKLRASRATLEIARTFNFNVFASSIEHVPHVNAQDPPLWMMLHARVQNVFSSFLNCSCDASTRECAGLAPLDDVVYNGPNRFLLVSVACPAARPHVNARALPTSGHSCTDWFMFVLHVFTTNSSPTSPRKQKHFCFVKPALCLESLPCPHQTDPCT